MKLFTVGVIESPHIGDSDNPMRLRAMLETKVRTSSVPLVVLDTPTFTMPASEPTIPEVDTRPFADVRQGIIDAIRHDDSVIEALMVLRRSGPIVHLASEFGEREADPMVDLFDAIANAVMRRHMALDWTE